jgi:hypothetical protein
MWRAMNSRTLGILDWVSNLIARVLSVATAPSAAYQYMLGRLWSAAPSESEKRLKEAVGQALEVLNRGGALEERMLEARSLLAEGVKELGGE